MATQLGMLKPSRICKIFSFRKLFTVARSVCAIIGLFSRMREASGFRAAEPFTIMSAMFSASASLNDFRTVFAGCPDSRLRFMALKNLFNELFLLAADASASRRVFAREKSATCDSTCRNCDIGRWVATCVRESARLSATFSVSRPFT